MKTPHTTHTFFYGYVVAAACFATWFIGWGGYAMSFGVFFKPLLEEFHWTRAETSIAYAVSLLVQAGLGIVMGWLTDRLGPRIVVSVFGSFLGWSFLLVSQVNSLWQFIVFYAVVGGIGASTLNIPIMATATRWFVKRRGLMAGIIQTGAGAGGFVFAPLAGWLILHYGWRTASIVLGVLAAVLMVLAGLFLVRDPRDMGLFPDGLRPGPEKVAGPSKVDIRPSRTSFRNIFKTAPFWMLTIIYASFGYYRSTFTAHLAAHVQDVGFTLSDGAYVLALISIGTILGRIGMGRLGDMIGTRRTLIMSFMVTALIIAWLTMSDRLWELYVFGIFYGIGWGAVAVLRFAVTAEVFGLGSVGLIMGILGFSESLAATFSTYFGGFLFDRSGNYDLAFILCIAVSVLGMLMSWRLKPRLLSDTPEA